MKRTKQTALTLALGSAIAASLASAPVQAAESPFAAQTLENGYMVAGTDKTTEGKCGGMKDKEGTCAGSKAKTTTKAKEGNCGGMKGKEGTCAGSKGDAMKDEGKAPPDKAKEGNCGGMKGKEGKCGAMK